jgi:hypothetical protein
MRAAVLVARFAAGQDAAFVAGDENYFFDRKSNGCN